LFKLSKKVVISEFLPKIFILNAVTNTTGAWCDEYFYIFMCFPFKCVSQGEFEGVFPKDLRRGTATRTKFGAHFWRRLIANIDLAQQFGATLLAVVSELRRNHCEQTNDLLSSMREDHVMGSH
jgi:hypothetical protein